MRPRVAAVALSVVLFALVAYWATLDAESRRPLPRAQRPYRKSVPLPARIVACELLVGDRRAYAINFAGCPPRRRRLRRIRPTVPRGDALN